NYQEPRRIRSAAESLSESASLHAPPGRHEGAHHRGRRSEEDELVDAGRRSGRDTRARDRPWDCSPTGSSDGRRGSDANAGGDAGEANPVSNAHGKRRATSAATARLDARDKRHDRVGGGFRHEPDYSDHRWWSSLG